MQQPQCSSLTRPGKYTCHPLKAKRLTLTAPLREAGAMMARTSPRTTSGRMPSGAERALTPSERGLAPPPLASAIDLGAVRIVARWHTPVARLFNVTVVRGARIFWANAPVEAVSLFERAHLAHEIVHVWQYKALRRTGLELLASRVYRYRLTHGRPFVSYGYEQQASIVEDFIRMRAGAMPRRALGSIAPITEYERTIATGGQFI